MDPRKSILHGRMSDCPALIKCYPYLGKAFGHVFGDHRSFTAVRANESGLTTLQVRCPGAALSLVFCSSGSTARSADTSRHCRKAVMQASGSKVPVATIGASEDGPGHTLPTSEGETMCQRPQPYCQQTLLPSASRSWSPSPSFP